MNETAGTAALRLLLAAAGIVPPAASFPGIRFSNAAYFPDYLAGLNELASNSWGEASQHGLLEGSLPGSTRAPPGGGAVIYECLLQ